MKYTTEYPELLKQLYKPPERLYYEGDVELMNKPCVAIVGTRRCTEYGELMTKEIIKDLSILDIVIVSGLAKGIDTIAHKAAIANSLPTIAVLGCGLANIYPRENIPLAKKISQDHLIISEFPPDTQPLKHHFPQRNRIISGLSIATIVVEAPEKSGALSTARYALEQGRDIYAVPGDIDRENSMGVLRILQNGGAYPIASGKEVVEILRQQPKLDLKPMPNEPLPQKATPLRLGPNEKKIIQALSKHRGRDFDIIKEKTGLPTKELLITLTKLELQGLTTTKRGKFIRLVDST